MQVLKIQIANDINNFIKSGSEVEMLIPMEKVDAIFHTPNDFPVVLVGDKQYKGMLEIIDTSITFVIETETYSHQSEALAKAELEATKQDYEAEGIILNSQAND